MSKKLKLETYGNEKEVKEGFATKVGTKFKSLWAKTIFPDMIKNKKEKKEWEKKIKKQAELEAREEIKAELVKQYKQEMIDKVKGKKKSKGAGFFDKLAKGFEGVGTNMDSKIKDGFGMGGGSNMDNKISSGFGIGGGQQSNNNPMGNTDIFSDDKISRMLGSGTSKQTTKKKSKKSKQPQQESAEDKIKRMLG